MFLDLQTLFVVATCITALLGLFLLVLWIQDRSVRALGWWGAAYLIGGIAVASWVVGPMASPIWSDEIAPALLFMCCGMIWTGARNFHGRKILPLAALAGSIVWLIAGDLADFTDRATVRVVVSSVIIATYAVLTALELKRERRNARLAHWRAIVVASLHGSIFLSPILVVHLMPDQPAGLGHASFALFALLTLLYVVGTAFTVVVMAKEHAVLLHKTAAVTDPLTGLFNRRGYLEAAQKLIERQSRKRERVTVLMFDLDHFKSINDRFGHYAGDEALRVFATTASTSTRIADIVGRLGGEEFSALLPGGLESAGIVAERVRLAFEESGYEIAGHVMQATVSIGAASAPANDLDLAGLIARADAALYRAKTSGRNRVAVAEDESAPHAVPALQGMETTVGVAAATA